jgi:hypothetical protein
MTTDNRPPTIDQKRHLRKFGLVMSVPFVLLGAFLFYKGRPAAPYLLAPGVLLVVFGLVWPLALGPVEKGWMWLAGKLQIVSTTVILSVVFYLIVTPIGLFMRIRGKDLLKMRRPDDQESFWVPADKEGSAVRYRKPY